MYIIYLDPPSGELHLICSIVLQRNLHKHVAQSISMPSVSLPISSLHPHFPSSSHKTTPSDPIPTDYINKISSAGPDAGTFCTLYSDANCEGKALPFTHPGIRELKREVWL
jgi:hypothetical protein